MLNWNTYAAELQFFDVLQQQVSVIEPYSVAKLWELYTTAQTRAIMDATAGGNGGGGGGGAYDPIKREAAAASSPSISQSEMYQKFRYVNT